MKKNSLLILGIVCAIVGGIVFFVSKSRGLSKQTESTSSEKIQVITSFYPLYFFAQQVGGDKAIIKNIVPVGAEPHDYEPTTQDMVLIENSRLIIFNGGGLEAWRENIEQNIDTNKTIIIAAGDGLFTRQTPEIGESGIDPHVWLDPTLAKKMVDNIAQGFKQSDPANKSYYQANADTLKTSLDNLDTAYRQGLSNCAQKNIITSHAAFIYLTATYGLNQIAITGLSPDAEPSPQQLADIVRFARAENVKYIFFESLISPKLAQTIATEVGAQTLVLNPIEGLSDDELAQGKNYLTVMQDNLSNLQTALQCAN